MIWRNNYKETGVCFLMGGKRGQVAIFVIIAIVIVAAVAIIFLYPNLRIGITTGDFSPNNYLSTCMENSVRESIDILSKQGGYRNPEGYLIYNNEKIKYLCYASEYYQRCAVQQPMIKDHFEKELENMIDPEARECFESLKREYERRNYEISASNHQINVSVVPNVIEISLKSDVRVRKDELQENFDEFNIREDSEMYDLLMTAQNIIEFESTFGDSETTLYMQYYPELKIEKTKLGDGSKVYKLTNVVSEESFTFASRSQAWPPGYGLE